MAFELVGYLAGAAIAGLGIVGAAAYRTARAAVRRRRLRRRLVGKRPTPIGSIRRSGPATLEGQAVAQETLQSPVTRVPVIGLRIKLCFFFGPSSSLQQQEMDLQRVLGFELVDHTGHALVEPGPTCNALFVPEREVHVLHFETLFEHPVTEQLLTDAGVELFHLAGCERVELREYLLRDGDQCLVAGMAVLGARPADAAGYRDASWSATVRSPADDVMTIANRGRQMLRRPEVWRDLPPRLALELE